MIPISLLCLGGWRRDDVVFLGTRVAPRIVAAGGDVHRALAELERPAVIVVGPEILRDREPALLLAGYAAAGEGLRVVLAEDPGSPALPGPWGAGRRASVPSPRLFSSPLPGDVRTGIQTVDLFEGAEPTPPYRFGPARCVRVPRIAVRGAVESGLRLCLRPRPPLLEWLPDPRPFPAELLRALAALAALEAPCVKSWTARMRHGDWLPVPGCPRRWGCTAGAVVEAYRACCHGRLLREGATLEQAATALGYADARSIHRAMSRWSVARLWSPRLGPPTTN